MALTPETRVTQGDALGAVKTSVDLRLTQANTLAAYNFPSAQERITGLAVDAAIKPSRDIDVTQLFTLAAVRGRIDNRKIRAWTFSLDGHDFYVIRLDDTETLVYDMSSQQWMKWASKDENFWRAWTGMNWLGMSRNTFLSGAQSQIVAGDDVHGLLWTLDPTTGTDDHPRSGSSDPQPFERTVVGGVPMRLRETKNVGAAYLVASCGSPQTITAASIKLRTSDDAGKSWTDHGSITVTPSDYTQELSWRSIGLLRSPGRIFEVTDSGATVRIDSLDIR